MGEKLNSLLLDFKAHWEKPKKGNYVGYREVASLSVGGMGVKTVNSMMGYIQLAPRRRSHRGLRSKLPADDCDNRHNCFNRYLYIHL